MAAVFRKDATLNGDRLFTNSSEGETYLRLLNMEQESYLGNNKNINIQAQIKAEGFLDDSLLLHDNELYSYRGQNNQIDRKKYYVENHKETMRTKGCSTPLKSINGQLPRKNEILTPLGKNKIFKEAEDDLSRLQLSQTRTRINRAFEILRAPSIDTSRITLFLGDNSRNESNIGLSTSALRRKSKIFDQPQKSPALKEKILIDKNEFIYKQSNPRGVSSHGRFESNSPAYPASATKILMKSPRVNSWARESQVNASSCTALLSPGTPQSGMRGAHRFARPIARENERRVKDNKENEGDVSLSDIDNLKTTIRKSLEKQQKSHIRIDQNVLAGMIKTGRVASLSLGSGTKILKREHSPISNKLLKKDFGRPEAPEGVKNFNSGSVKNFYQDGNEENFPQTPRIPDDGVYYEPVEESGQDERIEQVFKKWRKEEEKSFSETSTIVKSTSDEMFSEGGLKSSIKILFVCIFLSSIYLVFNAGLEYSKRKFIF